MSWDQVTFLLLPLMPDKGLETSKLHSIFHLLWNKGALGDSLGNAMLRGENNKGTGKE